jgi:hypothetical protein
MIVVHQPAVCETSGATRLRCRLDGIAGMDSLWFDIEGLDADGIVLENSDAMVLACLLPAMKTGQNVVVKGTMSCRLYYNLTHHLIPILKQFIPTLKDTSIQPATLNKNALCSKGGVMSGFSGGIDSLCTYHDHSEDRAPREYVITHFVYNNVGSHGQSEAMAYENFRRRIARLKLFAQQEQMPLVTVNSNLDRLIGMSFELTHTVRNAVVALTMQKAFSKYIYSSGFHYSHICIRPSYHMGFLDPVIVPLVGTETLECISSGSRYTRVEKTERVATVSRWSSFLDVCVSPRWITRRVNCSRCWKCMRTELTLELLGKLHQFGEAFDLDVYSSFRNLYLVNVMGSRNPLLREIVRLMKSKGVPIPLSVSMAAALIPGAITRRIPGGIMGRLAARPKLTKLIAACLSV